MTDITADLDHMAAHAKAATKKLTDNAQDTATVAADRARAAALQAFEHIKASRAAKTLLGK